MTDLSRLRAILRNQSAAQEAGLRELTYDADPELPRSECDAHEIAAVLGGLVECTPVGACLVVRRTYGGASRYGRITVKESACTSGEGLNLLGGPTTWAESVTPPPGPLLFLDLETTGLSGGAGTIAFVVGLGFFDDGGFQTQQFFLTSFAAERALLAVVADCVRPAGAIVTFNGKSFDLPIMETRWLYHRMAPPLAEARHVDMLHPARRLWGWAEGGLIGLERALLGVWRDGDVSGAEVPSRYFSYLRRGDAQVLLPVLEHNRLDLLSLAALTGLACRLVEGGAGAARDAYECVGLGRLYERAQQYREAVACYRRAAGLDGAPVPDPPIRWPGGWYRRQTADRNTLRAEALYRLAVRWRRERRYAEAAAAWRDLLALECAPRLQEREAIAALAIHHEHREKDLPAAHAFARRALDAEREPRRRQGVQHRLTRLERKLARR